MSIYRDLWLFFITLWVVVVTLRIWWSFSPSTLSPSFFLIIVISHQNFFSRRLYSLRDQTYGLCSPDYSEFRGVGWSSVRVYVMISSLITRRERDLANIISPILVGRSPILSLILFPLPLLLFFLFLLYLFLLFTTIYIKLTEVRRVYIIVVSGRVFVHGVCNRHIIE